MPTTATEYAQTAQEHTLETIRQSQNAVVEAVRTWSNAVEKIVPDAPAVPFSDQLPSPQEIVQTSFEFAEQLLKVQREFAESVLKAAAPAVEPKPASKKS